jgi:hypothetical protein
VILTRKSFLVNFLIVGSPKYVYIFCQRKNHVDKEEYVFRRLSDFPYADLLTKTWAAEYGPSGVRVNAVSPGPTRTEGTVAMGEGLEQLAAQAQAHRPASADEIAEAIVFLATDRASFIYGAKLAVDGGRTAI